MEKFDITPYGKVKITYQWNSKPIVFENYKVQYCRQRIHAKKSYSFNISGTDLAKLVQLYNNCHGLQLPFLFTYDGITEVCYFSQPISPKCFVEKGEVKAYTCAVSIEADSQVIKYPSPSEDDELPLPYLAEGIDAEYNWHTDLVSLGERTGRRLVTDKPRRKISATWHGDKAMRDNMISLFNSHCRVPIKYKFNGEILKVLFPDKIEITDIRELSTIMGYECQMELEVVD